MPVILVALPKNVKIGALFCPNGLFLLKLTDFSFFCSMKVTFKTVLKTFYHASSFFFLSFKKKKKKDFVALPFSQTQLVNIQIIGNCCPP